MIKKILIFFVYISLFGFNCKDKLFSFSNSFNEEKRGSIKDFLYLLATQKCNINIVAKDKETEKFLNTKMPFVRIKDYTLSQILDLLIKSKGFFYDLKNGELDISFYKTKDYKIDFISSSRIGVSKLDASNNRIENNYVFNFWNTLKMQIYTILLNNSFDKKQVFKPIVNVDTGIIVVTGTMRQLRAVDKFITHLEESLNKEVLIDVKIYSVDLSNSHKVGIDWSKFSLSLNSKSIPLEATYIAGKKSIFKTVTFNSEAFLNFLSKNGNVNSVSNPKIVALNNQKAIISVGDTVYYKYATKVLYNNNNSPQTEYKIDSKFVGVVLDITPQISNNKEIILNISPRISAFRDLNQINNIRDMPPDTRDNTMQSVVKIKDNQTLILGGFISNDTSLKVNGIPILKEIPLIKYLFSSKEKISNKKELVFVITPHIINFSKKRDLKELKFGSF